MKRLGWAPAIILALWLVQAACNLPAAIPDTGGTAPQQVTTPPAEQSEAAAETALPSVTPAAKPPPTLSVLAGVIGGVVWQDVCIHGGDGLAAPGSAAAGCIPVELEDFRANGFRDAMEPGISSLSVTLSGGACRLDGQAVPELAKAFTDSDGTYTFAGLVSGQYCVSIDPSEPGNDAVLSSGDWSFPGASGGSQTVTLMSGEHKTDVNFGWDAGLQVAAAAETQASTPQVSLAEGTPEVQVSGGVTKVESTLEVEVSGGVTSVEGRCSNQATFMADVTIPDDSVLPAGSPFVKTWRLRNDGTCTWSPDEYRLVLSSGDPLGGPTEVALPHAVPPGQTVDLSVNLVAPVLPGAYGNTWLLQVNPEGRPGTTLGVGPDRSGPLYTRIIVPAPAGQASAPTPPGPQAMLPVIPIQSIQFEAGTTSAVIEGSLGPGERKGFALRAGQGYALIAKVESNGSSVQVSIFGEDGQAMPVSTRPDGAFLVSPLPSNQRYFVILSDQGQGSSFALLVEIPALISASSSGGSAAVGGAGVDGRPVTYQVLVQAGQTLSVALADSAGEAALQIEGLQDGQTLIHKDQAASSWTGVVPETQDYLIRVVPSGESAAFALQIEIRP